MMKAEEFPQNIEELRLGSIYNVLYKGSLISIFSGTFFSFIYLAETGNNMIFLWLLFVYLSGIKEFICTYIFKKRVEFIPLSFWPKILTFTAVSTSLTWGAVSFFMLGVSDLTLNYIFITLLIGISVGGAFATLAFERTSICYIFLMITCLIIKTLIEQKEYFIWFVILQVLFILYSILLIRVFNRTVRTAEYVSISAQTELKLEKELQTEKLKSIQSARLASLGEMAAGISHEINNPLSLLRGRVDILEEIVSKKNYNEDDLADFVASAKKSTDRINKIIQSMKNLSRIKDETEFSSFQITDALEEIKTLVLHRLHLKSIDYQVELRGTYYFADRGEIEQVILNLVNNAIDAIENNPGEKWIKLIETTDENYDYIHILDSGNGIASEQVYRIFDPFYTSKEAGKGTGLGLSISKNLMARNNGDLYYNEAFDNTCFTLSFKKV
tara:strand:- start:7818 stop:9146 length:1329 start_codon:yes stop_codon:yes gene_type:complete